MTRGTQNLVHSIRSDRGARVGLFIWDMKGLIMLGSRTSGTGGRRLRPKNLDMTGPFQWQMNGGIKILYRI
jgi:hypothetical protein